MIGKIHQIGLTTLGIILVNMHPLESIVTQATPIKNQVQPDQSLVTLEGKIIKKPWTQSLESWVAGGSDYYVLDVGNQKIEKRTAAEGVILRGSPEISVESFAKYVGKRVRIQGKYINSKPYSPKNPMESYPTDFNGKPLPRGGGFQVKSITEIKR